MTMDAVMLPQRIRKQNGEELHSGVDCEGAVDYLIALGELEDDNCIGWAEEGGHSISKISQLL